MHEVIITGASGFIGAWITRLLQAQGFAVTCLVRPESNLWRLSGLDNIVIVRASEESWARQLESHIKPIVVLADWWGVENTYRNDSNQESNFLRWVACANVIKNNSVEVLVGIGSQAELGPVQGEILENCADGPTTEYGRVKVATRNKLQEIFNDSGTRFIWARAFSIYGQMDAESWFIPTITRAMLTRTEFGMTAGEQVWSYTHAFDFASGVIAAIRNSSISGIVHISSSELIEIRVLAEFIALNFGDRDLLKIGALPYRPDQVMMLAPINSKLSAVNWESQVSLLQGGISDYVQWYSGQNLPGLNLKNRKFMPLTLPTSQEKY